MATAVNFYQPGTDPAIDMQQIQRQRDIAAMLMKQGQDSPQGQMVSGHYVAPSAGGYIAQLVSALGGGLMTRRADENERTLAQTLAANRASDAAGIMSAMNGTPGVPSRTINPATPNDDEGNPMPSAQTDAVPAKGPDLSRALAIALQSQDPTFRGMAPDLMKRSMNEAEFRSMYGGGGTPGAPAAGSAPSGGGSPYIGTGYGQIPPEMARSLYLKDPAELAKALLEARKPTALREGDLVGPNGQGGVTSLFSQPKLSPNMQVTGRDPMTGQVTSAGAVPGSVGAVGSLAGAEANAKEGAASDNTMVTVDTPQGPKMMTRTQAKALAAGNQPPAPPPVASPQVTQGAPVRGNFTGTPEQVLDQINSSPVPDAVKAQMRQAYANQQSGNNPPFNPMGTGALPAPAQPQATAAPQGPGIALQDDSSKKFGQQVATQSADALLASRDKAKTASDDLLNIGQARKAIQGGTFQGSGADTKLAVAKFINANIPGVTVEAEKVGNTDYLKSTLGSSLLAQAKSLGGNPSNADAERINDIVGSIGKDPQAMNKLLDWREAMATRAIQNHNAMVGDAEKRGMQSPYELRVTPQQAAPAAGGGFRIIGVQ